MSGIGSARELYRIGTVARMTGFSTAVLRAWERRFGLLEPVRGAGGHRLYTPDDLRVLERVRELLDEGRSIGEIAPVGRERLLEERSRGASADAAPVARVPRSAQRPVAWLESCRDEIVDAAIAVDGDRIEHALDEVFAGVPPEIVLSNVIEPAAREIGDAWMEDRCSVAGEHLASGIFVKRLHALVHARNATTGTGAARVVCACFPDEGHELGALSVAFHLCRLGLHVTYLGARLPFEDLEVALRKVEPSGAYISVSRRVLLETHRPMLLELLERWAHKVTFIIGGRGVTAGDEEITRHGALLWPLARPLAGIGASFLPGAGAGDSRGGKEKTGDRE